MVGKGAFRYIVLLGMILFVTLLLASPAALAQGEESVPMQEEVLIEVNELGDAHVTDTITYDEAWFEEFGGVFDENPFLLSRRYREDSDVGEVENFDADIDSGDATVTITFDTPGLVYNLGDGWEIYGYGGYGLSDASDEEVVLEAVWENVNSEYTLWFDMPLEQKVTIDLPDGATDASFDDATGTIRYQLAYVPGEEGAQDGGGNILAENKTTFIIVFGLLMALSLLLFLFAITRKVKEAPAVAAVAAAPVTTAPVTAPETAPSPPAAAPAPPEEPPQAAEEKDMQMFCRKCGNPKESPDERFCRKCGNPHEPV